MSWADMPNRDDAPRRGGAAESGKVDFDRDFVDLRRRGRHLIAEIVRLSRQLSDLQNLIRARQGAGDGPHGGAASGRERRATR